MALCFEFFSSSGISLLFERIVPIIVSLKGSLSEDLAIGTDVNQLSQVIFLHDQWVLFDNSVMKYSPRGSPFVSVPLPI